MGLIVGHKGQELEVVEVPTFTQEKLQRALRGDFQRYLQQSDPRGNPQGLGGDNDAYSGDVGADITGASSV